MVLAIGDKIPAWAEDACAEYVRRMPRQARLEIMAIKPEQRIVQGVARIKAAESMRLLARCPPGALRVALDERGRQVSTRELADLLSGWMQSGRDVAFFIGGADGLDAEMLAQADVKLALSRLTLPHALVRVLLAEQLYRAASLIAGHPYHRD